MPATPIAGAGMTAPSLSPELVLVSPDLRATPCAASRALAGRLDPAAVQAASAHARPGTGRTCGAPARARASARRARRALRIRQRDASAVLGGGLVAVTATLAMVADLLH